MKKTYINPTMKVIELKPARLLSGSNLGLGDPGSANDAEAPEFGFYE